MHTDFWWENILEGSHFLKVGRQWEYMNIVVRL
jgi:hypothetical protein